MKEIKPIEVIRKVAGALPSECRENIGRESLLMKTIMDYLHFDFLQSQHFNQIKLTI